MERLQERMKMANKAFDSFQEVLEIPSPTAIERDAAIQRFEFTFEAVWKAAKQFLFDLRMNQI
jgi:Nucleotidyltransferase substrate binding protein like